MAWSHASRSSLWSRFRRWLELGIHLYRILLLSTPLAVTAPLVLATRDAAPAIENAWWNYATWAAKASSSPALIKFLQWASTRRDMFPPSFCDRFNAFHESAPVHSWAETEDALATAFGPAWRTVLDLDENPIGSGCIAQVYRGRLRKTGEEVAVKIIHPQVKQLIALDLELMRAGVGFLEAFPQLRYLSGRESVVQFAALMKRQLNLRAEAENLVRFAEHFRERRGLLRFPQPKMDLTTSSVLVESYEDGLHFQEMLTQCDVTQRKRIAKVVLESYLRMVFLDNFAHGDLHPGNLLFHGHDHRTNPSGSGKGRPSDPMVVAIDAGIVTKLEPNDLKNFVDLFHAVATGDGYKAGQLIVQHSQPTVTISPSGERVEHRCTDTESFCRNMERIVSDALKLNLRLSEVHVGSLLREVMELCCSHQVKLEGKYASIVISIAVLEAVGRQLDPELDVLSMALPIIVQSQLQRAWKRNSSTATALVPAASVA
ncbi:TPA: hypothetical protein N0F65_005945 [Lagenidium giganteum]|uniref:Protein kinase domain-containing protein n=1 Tax=Lagenidium giganteum TaxID=4803 RepID=A0AAV2Z7F7_9STRA|nr:TPA: hypothetical protein N0F65_005945 [Lagenidium giganteum]